jgi:hypothetical protein
MVTLAKISASEVIAQSREAVGLPASAGPEIDDAFLAALLRRAAGNECPCSRATLRAKVLEGLNGLADQPDTLAERIEEAIENLVIVGDLLELHDVATGDEEARSTWVFAAPPSYVVRPRSVFLAGIVPDQDNFLPPFLASRVHHEGVARALYPEPSEDLAQELRDLGLIEVSEAVWLRTPRFEPPAAMLESGQRQLEAQPPAGTVRDLVLIDPATSVRFYPKRWSAPHARHKGLYVARRPQEFGSPIWCLAMVDTGEVRQILDLPPRRSRWRGCDHAWHYQLAIDSVRGEPQVYRRRDLGEGSRFDFFSPLPQWAQRRLIIFGNAVPRENCLFSYVVAAREADAEERFLRERVWLSPIEGDGG